MKSITYKDTGGRYQDYLKRLLAEQGVESPTAEDIPDRRIARMKDGTTHLAYEAKHAVGLDSGFALAGWPALVEAAVLELNAPAPDGGQDPLVRCIGLLRELGHGLDGGEAGPPGPAGTSAAGDVPPWPEPSAAGRGERAGDGGRPVSPDTETGEEVYLLDDEDWPRD